MKCFSLFSGIGGFDLAARNQGHEIVGACEIDKYARSIYAKQFPKVKIYKDATKINPKELPDFDIIDAGFPCQAFSLAGRRLGFEEPRGELFFEIIRIAKEKRPRLLLLENVKGLLSHDSGNTFRTILATLDAIGYDAQWQMLNSKYWVPQNRERIFIVANLRGTRRPQVFPVTENDGQGDAKRTVVRTLTGGAHSGGLHSNMTGIVWSQGKIKERDYSTAIDANYYKGLDSHGARTGIKESKLKQLNNPNHSLYRVYDSDGIARTIKNSFRWRYIYWFICNTSNNSWTSKQKPDWKTIQNRW